MSDLQSEKILRSLGVKEWAVLCTWLAQRGAKDSLGNGLGTFTIKEKRAFILHFARFFVPLHPEIK